MIRGAETMFVRRRLSLAAFAAATALAACSGTAPLTKHHAAATIQRQKGGFTLTEHVHVQADVRAEFDGAVKMLDARRYNQAIAMLHTATQKAPNLVAARIDLGMAYAKVGKLGKAERNLKRAVALDPRQIVAYNELGIVQRREGHFAAARASYEKALALAPNFYYSRLNLAILCDLYLSDRKCALKNYLAYQKLMPGDKHVAVWIRELRSRGEH